MRYTNALLLLLIDYNFYLIRFIIVVHVKEAK